MTGRTAIEVADEIARIELSGAPRTVLIDAEAMGPPGSPVEAQVRRQLTGLGVEVVQVGADQPTLVGSSVGLFGRDRQAVPLCHAWYVGSDQCPDWMHPTKGMGAPTTTQILGFLGTSFAQERAGAAFRAASAGQLTPSVVEYAAEILVGVDRAQAPSAVFASAPAAPPSLDADRIATLIRTAIRGIDDCFAANGAIAAGPPRRSADEADYWFFWQRDAAHVAVALAALVRSGPDEDIRRSARVRLDAYLGFIAKLGRSLSSHVSGPGVAASRCTIVGKPVLGYGDPQPDGPAASAIAILTATEQPTDALEAARPFLEFLSAPDADQPGFDLWELTVGRSFHATNLGRRALRLGLAAAEATDDAATDRYGAAVARRLLELEEFRDRSTGCFIDVLSPRPGWFGATSRLDMSVIGSVMFGYDPTDDAFSVSDSGIAATMLALDEHYADRWPINVAWLAGGHLGRGIGRFPEDCNDGLGSTGGNPWPVTTLWAAQYYLHRAATARPSEQAADLRRGNGYLDFVLAHCDLGGIGEQIDGATGLSRGARPLAWAHAELITTLLAMATRPGHMPTQPGN